MDRSVPPAAPPQLRPRRAATLPPRRRLAAGGALAALAAVAAACSSGSAGSGSATGAATAQAAQAVRSAPVATLATGSAVMALTVTSDEHAPGTSGGAPVGLAMFGNYDFHTQQGDGLLRITGVAGSAAQSFQAHIIFTTGALYLQATGPFSGLGGGKPWVEITASSFSSLFSSAAPGSKGGALGGLGSALIGQPLAALDLFHTQALTASVVGHPTTGGQRTTEYAVTVAPATAAAQATGQAKTLFRSLGPAPLHFDVWVDPSGRLVKMSAQDIGSKASSGGQITGVTVTLANLGSPVTVTVPPASQVASAPATGSSGSSAG